MIYLILFMEVESYKKAKKFSDENFFLTLFAIRGGGRNLKNFSDEKFFLTVSSIRLCVE